MKNFFSAIQGKFDAKYHGRYLGNIIEQIAAMRPDVVHPLVKSAPMGSGRWPLSSVQRVDSESLYLDGDQRINDRRADLQITLETQERVGRILVEVKMHDKFLEGQLQDYVTWARNRRPEDADDRAVIVLTAFPLTGEEDEYIRTNRGYIKHMYLSDLVEALKPLESESELISLFANYLQEEGYAMYQLSSGKEDAGDLEALRSFLVLNFLPHQSGHSKVASSKKVARGPIVFSNLVQNWQTVSDRLARTSLKLNRRPTVRYFPQQFQRDSDRLGTTLQDSDLFEARRQVRLAKDWGRYWLTADCICRDGDSEDSLRIEWGQIIEIHHGETRKSHKHAIDCSVYALVRQGARQLGGSLHSLEHGIEDPLLYRVESFMEMLMHQIQQAAANACKTEPGIASVLPWRA